MKIYRITAAFLLIVLSIATFSGCTTFDNFKTAFIDKPEENTATILIGVYEPMTGVDSESSQAEIEGIELAHEMYPTVNGKFVQLEYADNASDIYAAETAIKELILKEPAVILGSYGSVYSMVAGEYINEAQIPAIAIPAITTITSGYVTSTPIREIYWPGTCWKARRRLRPGYCCLKVMTRRWLWLRPLPTG